MKLAAARTLAGRVAAVLPTVAWAALATAQSPPPRAGKVFLSGENPVIFLFDRPGGETETFVSFWRIHWSPVGPGHVCYVTRGHEKGADALRVALYDNQRLFEYLTNEVLGTYNKSYLERPFIPVGGATFVPHGDSIRERRETCRSDAYAIDLAWRDLQPGGLVDILPAADRRTLSGSRTFASPLATQKSPSTARPHRVCPCRAPRSSRSAKPGSASVS